MNFKAPFGTPYPIERQIKKSRPGPASEIAINFSYEYGLINLSLITVNNFGSRRYLGWGDPSIMTSTASVKADEKVVHRHIDHRGPFQAKICMF